MSTNESLESPSDAVRFLTSLFVPADIILYRPIETWVEEEKKKSRTVYRHTLHRAAEPGLIKLTVEQLLRTSETEKANLFFGVAPRFGIKGKFDLAWQIRTLRVIWTDIDRVTSVELAERLAKSELPSPSITVASGGGFHLYWLLDEPYLIDDAGDPPPVETEWVEEDGKKTPLKYIINGNGERIDLTNRALLPKLSPKAVHFQDILKGLAKTIDGDHTHDLSRILRIPGTLNRKDERKGRAPVPCRLVELDAARRYSIKQFEHLATRSPDVQRRDAIAKMPLPSKRKLSPPKRDRLATAVAQADVAPEGSRSEGDFAACCEAIRNGVPKDEFWPQVENISKFKDRGREYFDLTWTNAENDIKAEAYRKLSSPKGEKRKSPSTHNGRVIRIEPVTTPVGETLRQVTDTLIAAKDCFVRAEQLVVVNDTNVSAILSAPELAGLLNEHVEIFYVDGDMGKFQPLASNYANTWLNHRRVKNRLPEIKLFTRNPVYTRDWRLVAPGHDAQSGIYYAGVEVRPQIGMSHLNTLLKDFCFLGPSDRTNYIGMLLTAVLIPHFIGSKPAGLFNGNQPNLGKTMLAQMIAILRDGQQTVTAAFNPNDEEFEKRLGALVREGATTLIIDNAKSKGRKTRIESACLEKCLTDKVLSFRLLGKSENIRVENSHIFCITANTPDVSTDLVTRSVVINLQYEGDPTKRTFTMPDPEGYAEQHRTELLGELLGMVDRWLKAGKPLANVHTRFNKAGWGNIVGGILKLAGEPDFLANAEEAAKGLDDTRREFIELVSLLADHPQGCWTPTELVDLCHQEGLLASDLGEGSARSLSTRMGTIAGRYIDERFGTSDGREIVFRRGDGRKGAVYSVGVTEKTPNLGPDAEPLPNLRTA